VTAAVGDPAELLDIDVDQFAGPVVLVTADLPADPDPGGPVQVVRSRWASRGTR
jgi:hypothetical protein